MATTDKDFAKQIDDDVQLLDEKIVEAINLKNGLKISDPKRETLSVVIDQLMFTRTNLRIQVLDKSLKDPQLQAALAKIKTASDSLKKEAAKMTNATTFINNANAVIGAATSVINFVKNAG